ncbi:MAG: nucleoside triphosphate pyrophosphohydrolase [Gammaproteobacteria bacterium]|nr:nucleoside triphosphate pyrophosphohydrolase [Gammaproteobacteria bacterium]
MAGQITVAGLGPGDLSRVAGRAAEILLDPSRTVIVRTLEHPAARQLADLRPVEVADDLYEAAADFDEVYERLARRVIEAAATGNVVLALPGSPSMAERTTGLVLEAAQAAAISVEVLAGESFLDLLAAEVGIDLLGVQILDGRDLPDPLFLHLPTVIAQVDVPMVLADVRDRLLSVLSDDTEIVVARDLGTADTDIARVPLSGLDTSMAGLRTTLYLEPGPAGWPGLITTMRRLRRECPWDRSQTHHSLVRNLVEEAYELVDALSVLPVEAPGGEPDYGAYADVEEELGDVLLQVVFHTVMASEAGAFDIEDVAEVLRRKLVRRHPHVFGDVEVAGVDEVLRNWEEIKQEEKQRTSLMDDVPAGLPGLERAAKIQRRAASVGFDWNNVESVVDKIREETAELEAVLTDRTAAEDELGDLLFSVVNLSRHLSLDPEVAVRRAVDRFAARFRWMEESFDMSGRTLEELDTMWAAAKAAEKHEAEAADD